MAEDNSVQDVSTQEEIDFYENLAPKDKKLLDWILGPWRFLPESLFPKYYYYVAGKKRKDLASLYEVFPEELLKYFSEDFTALAKDFRKEFGDNDDLCIVNPGCGRGDLLMRLAGEGYKNLHGLDRSKAQLDSGRKAMEEAGVSDRVNLLYEYFQEYDYSQLGSKIDVVILNNLWSHISYEVAEKLMEALDPHLAPDARVYLGPMKKIPFFKGLMWPGKCRKFTKRFGIIVNYPTFRNFKKFNLGFEIFPCDNAGYRYIRLAKKQ